MSCPGGKERMRRLVETIAGGRLDTQPLVTHRFKLDQIADAYDLFANQRDGVFKVAIKAWAETPNDRIGPSAPDVAPARMPS